MFVYAKLDKIVLEDYMEKLTIGKIETLLECISSFGEYFDDYEVLDSAKHNLDTMHSKITSSNSDYAKCKISQNCKKCDHNVSTNPLHIICDLD